VNVRSRLRFRGTERELNGKELRRLGRLISAF
jgi:hypothetical protein